MEVELDERAAVDDLVGAAEALGGLATGALLAWRLVVAPQTQRCMDRSAS
jgi:hypothetical protein